MFRVMFRVMSMAYDLSWWRFGLRLVPGYSMPAPAAAPAPDLEQMPVPEEARPRAGPV